MQECSAQALPIVGMISFLTGLIFAFVGAIQLRQFGAGIYVANLVAVAMAREMGAIMTGIIMAGRTGAAFAAQIGSMKVSEEIDALRTLAISPMDFLVSPRLLALFFMMPLLVLYSDLVGILGGAFVGLTFLGISWTQYWNQTIGSMGLVDIATGLVKSAVFGVIVAMAGCERGMKVRKQRCLGRQCGDVSGRSRDFLDCSFRCNHRCDPRSVETLTVPNFCSRSHLVSSIENNFKSAGARCRCFLWKSAYPGGDRGQRA